jgi:hypothetical protein
MDAKTLSQIFAALGRKGGVARAKKLSPEQRKRIARKAAKARWSVKKSK